MRGMLLCVCQGECPSFDDMNEYEVMNELRREGLVDWVALHPQLCATDGDRFLEELLRAGEEVDELYVGACGPTMQEKMFRDAFEAVDFDKDKFIPIEVRNMTTEQVVEKFKEAIEK